MKKFILLLLLFLLSAPMLLAQSYGNEWINYSQKYYSFKITTEGLYKIDYTTLVSSGVDPSTFTSANMQIFGKDREQPIYVYDGGDNKMDAGDFFIFYAHRNDGWLDSTLYEDPNTIGNPAMSMFCDTLHYFFSWNSSSNNLRFVDEFNNDYDNFNRLAFGMTKAEYTVANPQYFQAKESNGTSSSFFRPGEGFGTDNMNALTSPDGMKIAPYFYTNNLYTGGIGLPAPPNAIFQSKSCSNSDADSINGDQVVYNHHLRLSMGTYLIKDTLWKGYKQIIVDEEIPVSALSNFYSEGTFHVVNDLNVKADQQIFNYWSLTYPRKTTMYGSKKDRFKFKNDNFAGQVRIDMANASVNVTNPIVLIFGARPKKIGVTFANDTVKAIITNSLNGEDQEYFIADSSLIVPITTLSAVNGTGEFTNFDSEDFEAADIMIYHPKLKSASIQYADYRTSPAGGSYNVVLANIEELYLQFGGGIPKHNAAIRRFSHFAYKKSVQKPVALTLLGKGFGIDKTRTQKLYFDNSLIPPYGYPSSDIAQTAGLEGTKNQPLIPTGRVAAYTETELEDYLNKLIEFESEQNQGSVYDSENKDWQKQILHFAGGDSKGLTDLISNFLRVFENVIEDSLFAGNVTTFAKSTSDPYDPTMVQTISEKIREGASILNFFGHSTASGFDITVDEPAIWENKGKYPVVIGNGCQSGDMYAGFDQSFSEKTVLLKDEGGIAFIGSTASETTTSLYDYCHEFYKQISYKNYGQPIAKQIQETIAYLQDFLTTGSGIILLNTYLTTNLNGDPLLKVNWHQNPEIELRTENVFIQPDNIDLGTDTIEFNIILKNLGQSVTEPFDVEIVRDFPGSAIDSIYSVTLPYLHYTDTIKLLLPLQASISVGINNFNINADIPSLITEQYDEANNNMLDYTLLLQLDAIVPVFPSEFAVLPYDTISVKCSTLDPISAVKTYRFELDTSAQFNSPFLRHYTITGPGGVQTVPHAEWLDENNIKVGLKCTDSMVCFWRVARDSSMLNWVQSSFQYIEDKEGWGQDHFFQFEKNKFSSIKLDTLNRVRIFDPLSKKLEAYGTHRVLYSPSSYYYEIEKLQADYGQCFGYTLLNIAVIDSLSLEPWGTRHGTENLDHNFGNVNDNGLCANRVMYYFAYNQDDPASLANFRNLVDNNIPNGNYVLIWSTVNGQFSKWDPAMFTSFNNLGFTSINASTYDRSFIAFVKKGHPETVIEELVPLADTANVGYDLKLTAQMSAVNYIGTEVSTVIGPSAEWKTLYWKQSPLEGTVGDTTHLSIQALNSDGDVQLTIDTVFTLRDSILNLQNLFNSSLFPYLRLKATYQDKENFTPANNERWHVLYQPVPEAAIDGSNGYYYSAIGDSINEGQSFTFSADIVNISDYDMDSMLVHYWVEDQDRVKHYIEKKYLDSLRVGQVIKDTVVVNTLGYGGINSFWMEINPYVDGVSGETDQPEQYHFNNLLQIPFYVKTDDLNPILDVTFNGRHILNGDIVDPNSEIQISLKDDNPFLVMNSDADTSLFGVYLTAPDGILRKIPFGIGTNKLEWTVAESSNLRFKINYPAMFEQDGIYELLVQGTDRSGNVSGDNKYTIKFEVIHESSITYLTNYPNPFSTSTRFVFTLTGSEVPDDILIQIMTISGKVVREINEEELGPLHIGRNVTEFSWNGTDQFGDPLANGIYLYRVMSRLNGESIKHRDSDIDQYFKKEFGKMYLMR